MHKSVCSNCFFAFFSEARMLSLLQQMCVPAAVDAAADDVVSHGGEAAAGKQADDAMEMERPSERHSHPGELHGSGWFRSPQPQRQYGEHVLHDYSWLLKMLTENLHQVLSNIAKRDPRLVQKNECSAMTWDIPKRIKLTPWGRPVVTAAAAAAQELLAQSPAAEGAEKADKAEEAEEAESTASPGKRARHDVAAVPVVRGGVRPTMGGVLAAVEVQPAQLLQDALEQVACQLSISHAERDTILRCLRSVVAKLDHDDAMHVLRTYAQTYEEIPLPCVYTVMVELIAHYFATTFEAQQQLCEHIKNLKHQTGRDFLRDCAENLAHNKKDVLAMKNKMKQNLQSKLLNALRLTLNPKQTDSGKLQANTTVTFAVCACMGQWAGHEQQDTDPLLWVECLALVGMRTHGLVAEGTLLNLTERIWEVMAF